MRLLFATVLSLAALATAASAQPERAEAPSASRDCFASTSWRGWSAPGDGNTLYLRVRQDDIYQVDLSPGTRVRDRPGTFLVNRVAGSGYICSPLDLDLTLRDQIGLRQTLIARSIRKLSAEEVSAIPREDLPG